MSNSLGEFSVKRKCVFVYCRLDGRNHYKGQVSKDKTLFLASVVLHHIHGQHAGPLLAEAKCLFISLSSTSVLTGTEICVFSCLSLMQQMQRPFSATSSAQNCASCLPITHIFNSHNCNNNVQCSITLVTFNRRSTVCAVMDVIPRFCTIKRAEASGWALCSMLS